MPTEKMLYREIQAYRQNPLIYLAFTLLLLLVGLFVKHLGLNEYSHALFLGALFLALVLNSFGNTTPTVREVQ
jgi:uncharacterized membrane protein YccC